MDTSSFVVAETGRNDREYDNWLITLSEVSVRLDALQSAVTELPNLCERSGLLAIE
jgi:hypothetical protein